MPDSRSPRSTRSSSVLPSPYFTPRPRCRGHQKCILVECSPFGHVQSCTIPYLLELFNLSARCQASFSTLSTEYLLTSVSAEEIGSILDVHYSLPSTFDDHYYTKCRMLIKLLKEIVLQLSTVSILHTQIARCLNLHGALPSDNAALTMARNLQLLYDCLSSKKSLVEGYLWQTLDDSPDKTEQTLTLMMNRIQNNPEVLQKLAFISLRNFHTLGKGGWLDDEVINYFIKKWCSRAGSTCLGLNTFFACKILFQQNSCVDAKTGVLTTRDESQVEKWCRKALTNLGLHTWDSVFIPINENHSHWYSAHINFRLRRIDIYDSLRENCLTNRQRPVALRKNTNLMLVLMWLTEVLARIRGDRVNLKNNIQTEWVFDPHTLVRFQPNRYDCGVHLLWHLKHVLEFNQVKPDFSDCTPSGLAFTDDMVGKRVRLAQELLDDCSL